MSTLPRNAPKERRTLYLFSKDLEDIDRYFDLRARAAAMSGRAPDTRKTEYLREAFHEFVNSYIRPRLAEIEGEKK
jgi:hypothetical protein